MLMSLQIELLSYSKYGSQTNISITWAFVRNTESQFPPQSYGIQICTLIHLYMKVWEALLTLSFLKALPPKHYPKVWLLCCATVWSTFQNKITFPPAFPVFEWQPFSAHLSKWIKLQECDWSPEAFGESNGYKGWIGAPTGELLINDLLL